VVENEKNEKFEIGITYSLHNTWLLNNETRQGFDNTSLINTSASYTNNYGLLFSYLINDKNSIVTEFFLHGLIKQHYETYKEGIYYNEDIEMNYSQIVLMYQYNINIFKRIPSAYAFKTGIYLSNFNKKQSSLENDVVDELSDFTKFDYGLKLAAGYKNNFNKITFEYGLNSEYGLKNIFKGNEQIPSNFNVTHPFHVGAYINLIYKL